MAVSASKTTRVTRTSTSASASSNSNSRSRNTRRHSFGSGHAVAYEDWVRVSFVARQRARAHQPAQSDISKQRKQAGVVRSAEPVMQRRRSTSRSNPRTNNGQQAATVVKTKTLRRQQPSRTSTTAAAATALTAARMTAFEKQLAAAVTAVKGDVEAETASALDNEEDWYYDNDDTGVFADDNVDDNNNNNYATTTTTTTATSTPFQTPQSQRASSDAKDTCQQSIAAIHSGHQGDFGNKYSSSTVVEVVPPADLTEQIDVAQQQSRCCWPSIHDVFYGVHDPYESDDSHATSHGNLQADGYTDDTDSTVAFHDLLFGDQQALVVVDANDDTFDDDDHDDDGFATTWRTWIVTAFTFMFAFWVGRFIVQQQPAIMHRLDALLGIMTTTGPNAPAPMPQDVAPMDVHSYPDVMLHASDMDDSDSALLLVPVDQQAPDPSMGDGQQV